MLAAFLVAMDIVSIMKFMLIVDSEGIVIRVVDLLLRFLSPFET